MPETTYNILNFEGPIGERNFGDVIREVHGTSSGRSRIRLSGEQLDSLIAVLFTYGLHYDEMAGEKRSRFLDTLIGGKLPLFHISQRFCLHLLNNIGPEARAELGQLQHMEHDMDNILSNERLLDFVEMELLDPTTSYRKWEYGRFAMVYMAQHFFGDAQWNAIENAKDKEVLLQKMAKRLDKQKGKLDPKEIQFLHLMAKGSLLPQKTTMAEFLFMGSHVQGHMMGLSARIRELSKILGNALEREISRQKGKGGPRL